MLGLITILVIVAVAFLGVGLWLWWWFPRWQMRSITAADPKARADIEDNFRKTIGQLLVGAMVLVGAGAGAAMAYRQLLSQQQAARDLLVSNQVSKGFEQLGSEKLVVWLGGSTR
jgi:formate hydrogenlyase subunit 3/multisubunit Na+/H+ antiporter MnhD subunit